MLPGLKKRGREGLLWRNEEEGAGPGGRGVRAVAGRVSEKLSGVGVRRLGTEERRWGMPHRRAACRKAGCSPLSSSPSLNCPLSPIRSCSCCCSRGGTGGLAPGGCTMAGSGVVSRGAADGSMSCGAAGSGWRLWQRSEERAEHPARVRARGEGGDSGSEHQGDGDRQQTNSSGCSPPAAPRGRLITNLAGGGGGWREQVGERCRLPARPFPSPPRGAPQAAGAAPGSAAGRGRQPGPGGSSPPCGAACEGTAGAGEVAGRAPVSRPREPAGNLRKVRQDLGVKVRPRGRPRKRETCQPPLAMAGSALLLLPLPALSGDRVARRLGALARQSPRDAGAGPAVQGPVRLTAPPLTQVKLSAPLCWGICPFSIHRSPFSGSEANRHVYAPPRPPQR